MLITIIFFFKQKTAYEMRISDWSSDVCSSDLTDGGSVTRDRPDGDRPQHHHRPQRAGDRRPAGKRPVAARDRAGQGGARLLAPRAADGAAPAEVGEDDRSHRDEIGRAHV